MRQINTSLFLLFFIFSVGANAQTEEGHYHGPRITEQEAKAAAKEILNNHVIEGKVDSSWKGTGISSASQRTYNHHLEWVVTFQNDSIEDPDKQTLYIFLTLGGEMTGINYTGK